MSRSIPTEDRISALPDPIICHILSFLSTKFAATTSILSKRWNPLWHLLLTLNFDDRTFPNYASFRIFVSTVFLSRNIKSPLRSFHLKCSKATNLHSHDINRLVCAAAQRGMENLILKMFGFSFRLKLPRSIFSCWTIVVLNLYGILLDDLSNVVVDFPCLKILHLSWVFIERLEYPPKLLSGCPILEELQINFLLVRGPKRLVLEENFQCLPNLIIANISKFLCSADVLFTLLCRAKFLCVELLSVNGEKVVVNWIDPTIVPECLSTQLRTCFLKGYNSTECEVQFEKYIMQNAKVLNTISIKSVDPMDIDVNHQMMSKLASSARASTTCELLFD